MTAVAVPLLTGEIFPGSAYSEYVKGVKLPQPFCSVRSFCLPSLSLVFMLLNAAACCSGLHADCNKLLLFLVIVSSPVKLRFNLYIFKTKKE